MAGQGCRAGEGLCVLTREFACSRYALSLGSLSVESTCSRYALSLGFRSTTRYALSRGYLSAGFASLAFVLGNGYSM